LGEVHSILPSAQFIVAQGERGLSKETASADEPGTERLAHAAPKISRKIRRRATILIFVFPMMTAALLRVNFGKSIRTLLPPPARPCQQRHVDDNAGPLDSQLALTYRLLDSRRAMEKGLGTRLAIDGAEYREM